MAGEGFDAFERDVRVRASLGDFDMHYAARHLKLDAARPL